MEIYQDKSQPIEKRVKDLLSKMTLEEKVGQLNQRLYGFDAYERKDNQINLSEVFKEEVKRFSGLGTLYGLYRSDPWSKKDFETGLTKAYSAKAYNLCQAYVLKNSRLKIPMLLSTECPHGHQALEGYLLPVNLAMGATFNPTLVKAAYKVSGKEMASMHVDFALVSMLDVLRDPRWGRSEECFSEDPYLASTMAFSVVEGIQEEGVAVVAKHFCAQGETTGGINASPASIGWNELSEIHLPPMAMAAKAGVKGVMAAYNDIDGIPCHGNGFLLKTVLRDYLGFEGLVMADGLAIDQLNRLTSDTMESGRLALKSGLDISLWDQAFSTLGQSCKEDEDLTKCLDEAVSRVLYLKFSRGLFEHPYIEELLPIEETSESILREENIYASHEESLQLARESLVLLKNEDYLLPISPGQNKHILVVGPRADALYDQLGDYAPYVDEKLGVTIAQGMKNINQACENPAYIDYKVLDDASLEFIFENPEAMQDLKEAAIKADIIIMALGGTSSRFEKSQFLDNGAALLGSDSSMDCGENVDLATLQLPKKQLKLAGLLSKHNQEIVTIIIQGRPYIVEELLGYSKSLLSAFYPGMLGGQAIAELIFGKISPSGRLPVSIPRSAGQVPAYYNSRSSYAAMAYKDMEHSPSFAFGDGLTYTTFDIKVTSIEGNYEKLKKENLSIKVFLDIHNQGRYASACVPQLYIHLEGDDVMPRRIELKDFSKVFIEAGQVKSCFLELTREKLERLYVDGTRHIKARHLTIWVKDQGRIYFEKRW